MKRSCMARALRNTASCTQSLVPLGMQLCVSRMVSTSAAFSILWVLSKRTVWGLTPTTIIGAVSISTGRLTSRTARAAVPLTRTTEIRSVEPSKTSAARRCSAESPSRLVGSRPRMLNRPFPAVVRPIQLSMSCKMRGVVNRTCLSSLV